MSEMGFHFSFLFSLRLDTQFAKHLNQYYDNSIIQITSNFPTVRLFDIFFYVSTELSNSTLNPISILLEDESVVELIYYNKIKINSRRNYTIN